MNFQDSNRIYNVSKFLNTEVPAPPISIFGFAPCLLQLPSAIGTITSSEALSIRSTLVVLKHQCASGLPGEVNT